MNYENILNNGLTLTRIPTNLNSDEQPIPIAIEDFQETLTLYMAQPSWFVAYLDYTVTIGCYTNEQQFTWYQQEGDTTLNPRYIQKLRIFNENEEFLIWRSRGHLFGRYRKDNDENDLLRPVVVAEHMLVGTQAAPLNNAYTKLTERRGATITLPFAGLNVDDNQKRIRIKTHNYVEYNAAHQATYTDCRFVSFTDGHNILS